LYLCPGLIVLGLIIYYFKVYRPKQQAALNYQLMSGAEMSDDTGYARLDGSKEGSYVCDVFLFDCILFVLRLIFFFFFSDSIFIN
jgi:hypothetical protein